MIYINLLPETEKRSYGELRGRKREARAVVIGRREEERRIEAKLVT
jgi:hypothetical protein